MQVGSRLRSLLALAGAAFAMAAASAALAATPLTVAYAGSMGAVMDKALGPAFDAANGAHFHGVGEGAYGLARLIAATQLRADVFVAVTPGPVRVLQKAGLMDGAVPVASTEMVIAYSPKSRFAKDFSAAAAGAKPWYTVLQEPGLRFGRTDPRTDPQGRNIVLAMQLAEAYYHQPGLVAKVLGPLDNPRQIFTEPSLLTRLEAGQIDASSGYLSAVVSHHLPCIKLPAEIDLGDPAMAATWYDRAGFMLTGSDGKPQRVTAEPLVFYAGVLKNAAHPQLAARFIEFVRSPAGQNLLAEYGYGKASGPSLRPHP